MAHPRDVHAPGTKVKSVKSEGSVATRVERFCPSCNESGLCGQWFQPPLGSQPQGLGRRLGTTALRFKSTHENQAAHEPHEVRELRVRLSTPPGAMEGFRSRNTRVHTVDSTLRAAGLLLAAHAPTPGHTHTHARARGTHTYTRVVEAPTCPPLSTAPATSRHPAWRRTHARPRPRPRPAASARSRLTSTWPSCYCAARGWPYRG